ncbi:TPA: hypothetical protein ACV5BL_004423 [Enterobacter hormaechei subsp. steigerwaltii]
MYSHAATALRRRRTHPEITLRTSRSAILTAHRDWLKVAILLISGLW